MAQEKLKTEWKFTKDGVNLFLVVDYEAEDITIWAKEEHDYYDFEQTSPKYLKSVAELMIKASELAEKELRKQDNIEHGELSTGYRDLHGKPIFYEDSVTLNNGERGIIMLCHGIPYVYYLNEPAKTPLNELHKELVTHGKTNSSSDNQKTQH